MAKVYVLWGRKKDDKSSVPIVTTVNGEPVYERKVIKHFKKVYKKKNLFCDLRIAEYEIPTVK